MNARSISWIGALLLGASTMTSGCAFTNVPLTLPTRGAQDAIPGGRGREVVVVSPFSDSRAIKKRCGMQKNGYNMDTADAKCMADPSEWLAQYIAATLSASGFKVLPPDAAHRPGAVRIEGALLKLFVEPVIGAWSGSLETDLSVRLVVSSETGLRAERTFFVKGTKKGVMLSTSGPFQESLERAAQAGATEIVEALIALLDRYPQLGSIREDSVVVAISSWTVQS